MRRGRHEGCEELWRWRGHKMKSGEFRGSSGFRGTEDRGVRIWELQSLGCPRI